MLGRTELSCGHALITASLAEKIQMLTASEIALVRASFAQVARIQDAAADLFYDRLFTVSPKLRELFPADLRGQKHKLMQISPQRSAV
jgi:hypothetical protein